MRTKDSNRQIDETTKETIHKNSFVFYHSYFEAIETLSRKNRLIAYEAIAKYALYGEEGKDLPNRVLGIIVMAKPNIDAAHKNYLRKMKSTSQKNQKGTSVFIDEEPIEKVPLPLKENEVVGGLLDIRIDDECFEP